MQGTNQDSVRCEQVLNGGTFSQEFRVGQDVEVATGLGVGFQDGSHRFGRSTGDGGLFDNDFGRVGNFGNSSSSQFNVVQICGETSAETTLLGRGVDRDEDQVGLFDSLVNFRREKKVSTSACLDDINESRFVDREVEVRVVPSVNSGLVQVDNGDLDVGAICDRGQYRQ